MNDPTPNSGRSGITPGEGVLILVALVAFVVILFAFGVLGCQVELKPGVANAATLGPPRTVYVNRGDTVVANMGETTCTARSHAWSALGFVCQVGGDYRARYGVIVNEREVAIVQYSSPSRYKVVVERLQSPLP